MPYRDAEVTEMLAETKDVLDAVRFAKLEASVRESQLLALQHGSEADAGIESCTPLRPPIQARPARSTRVIDTDKRLMVSSGR